MSTKLLCLFFRNLTAVALVSLAFGLVARAEQCSVEKQKITLAAIYEKAVREDLAKLKSRTGSAMLPDGLELQVTAMESAEEGREIGDPVVEILASFTTESGTKLWATAKGEKSGYKLPPFSLMFDTRLESRGFDREGNAINGRCRLTTIGYLEITNDSTNRLVTTFPLPTTVFIKLPENK